MTNVVISQPMYFPWPGFFEHIALADILVWLDDAQFSKGSYTNRIQVKLGDDRKWMSIPLDGRGTMTQIADLKAANTDWVSSHRELLRQSFRESPCRAEAMQLFEVALNHGKLVNDLIASTEEPARALGVLPLRILRSSDMNVPGSSWRRVLDIVKAVGGTRYITGHGAANYLDHQEFESEGITVDYMDYSLTPWPQTHGPFTPYVTILDLIASRGASSRETLKSNTMSWRSHLAKSNIK